MDIKIVYTPASQYKCQALVIICFEEEIQAGWNNGRFEGPVIQILERLVRGVEIKGKSGEVTIIHNALQMAAERIVITGMGKRSDLKQDGVRCAIAEAMRVVSKKGVSDVAVMLSDERYSGLDSQKAAQLITEGAILGNWSFRKYSTRSNDLAVIKNMALLVNSGIDSERLKDGINKGRIMAEAANLSREMINEPANRMTPADLDEKSRMIAGNNALEIEIFSQQELEKMGMRAVLAVSQGSSNPPVFIVVKYFGRQADEIDLALVGKAVTFDSGGISIKPSEKMETMKMDMAGGATVLSTMQAIARLKPAINVVGLVAAVENLPGGKAQRPGDVVQSMSGLTIEVISTDAEGRMTLAAVLTYARQIGARRIVDVATLTGACVVARGEVATGTFANNQELADKIINAGDEAGEYMWPMPMYTEYREQYKSDIADMKNVGGREAGAVTAALFLSEFVGDNPWVHLDVAGTAMISKDRKYWSKGGTGVPVRTLINLALALAEEI
jgi:leucyl aminopeptidase